MMKALSLLAAAGLIMASLVTRVSGSDGGSVEVKHRGLTIHVTSSGGILLNGGADADWSIESSVSFPGPQGIGQNRWTVDGAGGGGEQSEAGWQPVVGRDDEGNITIQSAGARYAMVRCIRPRGHRIEVTDTLTNTGSEDVGIIVRNSIGTAAGGELVEHRLCGMPGAADGDRSANPTVFVEQKNSRLGVVVEDNVGRVQFRARHQEGATSFGFENLGLPPGKRLTIEWAIYPFGADADYWTFINQVREDWNVNYTLPGPCDYIFLRNPPYDEIFSDPDKLRTYLQRKHLKVICAGPWLDYENYDSKTGTVIDRTRYKEILQSAKLLINSVDPDIRIVGLIEGPFVTFPDDLARDLLAALPPGTKQGYYEMTDEMMAIFRSRPDVWKRWGDSIVWTSSGRAKYELYFRGDHQPFICLTARPVVGNGQHAFLMEQAKFILDEVGLDGIYVDSFAGAKHWNYGYSYDKWDGVTVDIDPKMGTIARKYTDLALAGATSRAELLNLALKQGKLAIANDHPIAREEQSLAAIRFNESEFCFEPLTWADDQAPPLDMRPFEGNLSSPISLGFRPNRYEQQGVENYSKVIMKGAIAYLRHGLLYFHYNTELPESGPGSGEYGPFNHMFPITPRQLGEGFVIGDERIVACVSRPFEWRGKEKPRVLVFDLAGRETQHGIEPRQTSDGWMVDLKIQDWQNIAVIEGSGS
jgi:hypothetical protein